jgi:hypothetical protein
MAESHRVTMLPTAAETRPQHHLEEVRWRYERDLKAGGGYVMLPGGLARKYRGADRQWGWQWVFPASRMHQLPGMDRLYRHHLHESATQKAIKQA